MSKEPSNSKSLQGQFEIKMCSWPELRSRLCWVAAMS